MKSKPLRRQALGEEQAMKKEKQVSLQECPNPLCPWHKRINIPKKKWFRCHGYYTTNQHERVARFICINCHKTFTTRTVANYWHMRDDTLDIKELGKLWIAGSSICEIAKTYGVSDQQVRTRLRRYMEFAKTHWEYEI